MISEETTVVETTRAQVIAWGFRGNVFGQSGNFISKNEIETWKNEGATLNLSAEIAKIKLQISSEV